MSILDTQDRLKTDPKHSCKRCMGLCRPVDGRSEKYVALEGIQLAVVQSFCCLDDEISPAGGCELATIARTRAAWGKFCELLPLLTSTTISLAKREKLYDSCVRGTLLHASECWPLRREVMQRLLSNERAMLRWMLKIKAEGYVSVSTMYGRLNLTPLESNLRLTRLRWYRHVERSDKWLKKRTHLEIDGFKTEEDLVKLEVKQ